MQSLNEELMTINMQYQAKAEELTRINNDMKNLLDSTEIGTIFLDNKLDILRYTPQVRKLFNLIPTDVGRPITHVVSNFDNSLMENEIREVIETLANKEIEVKTKTDEWYRVRIMPYRTLDNFISGAVLTFTLITGYKQLEYMHWKVCSRILISLPALQGADLYVLTKITPSYLLTKLFTRFLMVKIKMRRVSRFSYMSQFIKTETMAKLLDKAKNGTGIKSADLVFADGTAGHGKIDVIPLKNRVAGKTHC
jgi:two-component system CheB/CheR fusion protein